MSVGYRPIQIANKLELKKKTVEGYIKDIYEFFDCRGTDYNCTVIAIRRGIAEGYIEDIKPLSQEKWHRVKYG